MNKVRGKLGGQASGVGGEHWGCGLPEIGKFHVYIIELRVTHVEYKAGVGELKGLATRCSTKQLPSLCLVSPM